MEDMIRKTMDELSALAERKGWTTISDALQRMRAKDDALRVTLAVPAGVSETAMASWVRDAVPGAELQVVSLAELAEPPYPTLHDDILLALSPCDHLLAIAELDAIERLCFYRPADSYAFVLTGANEIEGAGDEETVERGAWRILVPEPKPEWTGQDLRQYRCFLWSEGGEGWLRERIVADMSVLQDWLRRPSRDTPALRRCQLTQLLNITHEFVPSDLPAPDAVGVPETAAQFTYQLRSVRARITELRRRWMRLIDADAKLIERQLSTSLETLELNMLRELPQEIRRGAQNSEARTPDALQHLFSGFIARHVRQWNCEIGTALARRRDEIFSDTENLILGIDWPLVNRLLSRGGEAAQPYPKVLWANASGTADLASRVAFIEDAAPPAFLPASDSSRQLRAATAGAVTGAVALFLLGTGPVGIVAAGTGAFISGTAISRHMQNAETERFCDDFARPAIQNLMRQAAIQATRETQQRFRLLRDSLCAALDTLEDDLRNASMDSSVATGAAAVAGNVDAGDSASGYDDVLDRLDRYAMRLNEGFPPAG
jgi:hypothetical protein